MYVSIVHSFYCRVVFYWMYHSVFIHSPAEDTWIVSRLWWLSIVLLKTFVYTFFIFIFIFYCYAITVVCLFAPSLHPTPAEPPSLPHLHSPPWFCPCVLYSSSCNPLSPLSPPYSPLVIVRLFLTSMSLVIFCLLFSFVDYVPVKGTALWPSNSTSGIMP